MYRFTLIARSCGSDEVLGFCVVDVKDFIELDNASLRFGSSYPQGDLYVMAEGGMISDYELFELHDA